MLYIEYLFSPPLLKGFLLKIHMGLMASGCAAHPATFPAQMFRAGCTDKQAEEFWWWTLGGSLQVATCGQGLVGCTELVLAFLWL